MNKKEMEMEKVVIIGASGHAKVIAEAIELQKEYKIHGILDSYKELGLKVLDYEVVGDESLIPQLMSEGITKGIIAIGDNWSRYKMYLKIQEMAPSFEFITVIHPSAVVSPYAVIGRGTVILAAVVINAQSIVKEFSILNTGARFGHDGVMNEFSSLAPEASIGGNVTIGAYSAISIGASVIQGLTIGEHTVVGAGAVVTRPVPSFKISYGVPSKIIRDRMKGDPYLNMSTSSSYDVVLDCCTLSNQEEIEAFKQNLTALNSQNPFYIYELLDTSDMKGYELRYFILKRNEEILVLMPFYIREIEINGSTSPYFDVTSPYGYSGPLYNKTTHNKAILSSFWEKVDKWYRDNGIVSEFVRFNLNNNHMEYTGECSASLMNIKGDITNFENVWVNFKPKVRNNYRKAQQEELTLKLYTNDISMDIIKDFYDIYIQTMQRNNADDQYFHFIDYFKNLIQNNPESTLIAMVYKEDTPISTELILKGDGVLYSYLGGTISDYFYTRPNDFLKIEVMKWAQEQHYSYYVLGGGRNDGDGLYKYKKAFFPNDDDVIYYTGRKIINKEAYSVLVKQKFGEDTVVQLDDCINDYFPVYRKIEL